MFGMDLDVLRAVFVIHFGDMDICKNILRRSENDGGTNDGPTNTN